MDLKQPIGQKHLKSYFKKTIQNGRVPHAQLFVGGMGSGILPMAIAYASELLCNHYDEDSPERKLCAQKVRKLAHPDLHFVYPINKKHASTRPEISTDFINEWREFVVKNPYASLFEWLQHLGIENKQGSIKVYEAAELLKTLSLKSYEGGYKVVIIWAADKMNTQCANKLLKIIEEPPKKTVLLLLTEKEEQILSTIHSRCQKLHFAMLSEEDIANELVQAKGVELSLAKTIAHRAEGDYNKALHILEYNEEDAEFEAWFIHWVRTAFRAKGNKAVISDLLSWSEQIASRGRETQKKFLNYCIEVFRQAMLKNYTADSLLYFVADDPSFKMEQFSRFVHQNNIFEIVESLERAVYHIERNGNAKIIFGDLAINLTRLIHRKELI